MEEDDMWILLMFGVLLGGLGIFITIIAALDAKGDPSARWVVVLGIVLTCGSAIAFVFSGNEMRKEWGPTSPSLQSGHVYEVLDSMLYKTKQAVSFRQVVPSKGREQIKLFDEAPPKFFQAKRENDRWVYPPFNLESQKPKED